MGSHPARGLQGDRLDRFDQAGHAMSISSLPHFLDRTGDQLAQRVLLSQSHTPRQTPSGRQLLVCEGGEEMRQAGTACTNPGAVGSKAHRRSMGNREPEGIPCMQTLHASDQGASPIVSDRLLCISREVQEADSCVDQHSVGPSGSHWDRQVLQQLCSGSLETGEMGAQKRAGAAKLEGSSRQG